MAYHIALIDGEGDVWGARFPDFPGCHGGGATPEAAIADATTALRVFVADMIADGETVPEPRTLSQIVEDGDGPEKGEAAFNAFVPLLLDKGRPVRANISLDAGLLETIDAEAKRRGVTRSAFLVSAALDKITAGG